MAVPKLSVLKRQLFKVNRLLDHVTTKSTYKAENIESSPLELGRERKAENKKTQQIEKEQRADDERERRENAIIKAVEGGQREDSPSQLARYGMENRTKDRPSVTSLRSIAEGRNAGEEVGFVVRVHNLRRQSAKLTFFVFRQQNETIQGVLAYQEDVISEHMVRWAEHLSRETLVHVRGKLQEPRERVRDASIQTSELLVDSMHIVAELDEPLSIDVHGVDRLDTDEDTGEVNPAVPLRTRLANRIIDLRTPSSQGIFRINSGICNLFRTYLDSQGFMEIHTPKLQPAATESGASVFKVDYFKRTAFLAQSPQLAKQMCISADFGRVYEIGPVFRAEDSNTHRHLTEYTGLDLEMAIDKDYHEALRLIDDLFKSIFKGVYERYRREIDCVKTHYPHEDLLFLDETPILTFKEGVALLNENGWEEESGSKASEYEDLNTRAEIRLGQIIREKYKTDYYVLDKFPTSARPFYAMPDPENDKVTNSFDIFLRGQEIVTGGQRIHKTAFLKERMRQQGMAADSMKEYMQAFEWGAPPHAGAGLGLERIVMLLLNLGDIRNASLFPRDPKSLPLQKVVQTLPHPEADTLRVSCTDRSLPPLEKLIANYGDASNTAWLDERYTVWRCDRTGGAVGYAADNGYAIVLGNPLCDHAQYARLIATFLQHLKNQHLRPLWILVGAEVEELLATKLNWRSLSCVAEERLNVSEATSVTKKERQATNAGVKVSETGVCEPASEEFRERVEKRVKDWKANRNGKQAHLTEVLPFQDAEHRRYVYAEDADGTLCGLIVLAQLAPEHGYQVKFALDFPGSPSGTIELLISSALQSMQKSGIQQVTFGVGAQTELDVIHNLDAVRVKILSKTYKTITQQLKLIEKSQFREKFGTTNDPVYICYPKMGLGVNGTRTLIKFFEDEM